jgi:hypothetical protein
MRRMCVYTSDPAARGKRKAFIAAGGTSKKTIAAAVMPAMMTILRTLLATAAAALASSSRSYRLKRDPSRQWTALCAGSSAADIAAIAALQQKFVVRLN